MSQTCADAAKRAAAAAAVEMVENDMVLGLGSGSTAAWFVRLLAERVRETGLQVRGIATSSATARLAREMGLALSPLDAGAIDVTVDGTDAFDRDLNLVKGGGGALLQEKIVAAASARLVVLADEGKRVDRLGAFPLPVEVVRFGWKSTMRAIEGVLAGEDVGGHDIRLRDDAGEPLVTDEGHHVLDLHLLRIGDAPALAAALLAVPGVVETGLFIGMAERVIVGRADGGVEIIRRNPGLADAVEEMRSLDA